MLPRRRVRENENGIKSRTATPRFRTSGIKEFDDKELALIKGMELSGCSKLHIQNSLIKFYERCDEDYPEHRTKLRRFLVAEKLIPRIFDPDMHDHMPLNEVGLHHIHDRAPKEELVESNRGTKEPDEVHPGLVKSLKQRGYSLGMIADMVGLTSSQVKDMLEGREIKKSEAGSWS